MSGQPNIPSSIPPLPPDRPRTEYRVPREALVLIPRERAAGWARLRSPRYR